MKRISTHIGIFLIIQAILAYYLKDAFWNPSQYVYTFGGDGAFIYYNMIFQSFFGNGFELSNMNYPNFESIFMTDAQASLSLCFSLINDLFPSYLSPEKIVALSHRFHYLMIGFAGIFVFENLKLFEIKSSLAIPAAIFITLLSPMIIRLNAGHFGLAYPFVFAYVMFFLTQYFHKRTFNVSIFIGLIAVLLFFGLNNFYIGMINLTTLLLISGFYIFHKEFRNKALSLILSCVAIVGVLYSFIHFTDPGSDRIEIQWGYYSNSVDISSFLYPPTGLLNHMLSSFGHIKTHGGETWINLGLIPLIVLLILPLYFWLSKDKNGVKNRLPELFKAFAIASFILLIYASALLYRIPFFKEHLFHEFGILTMFKASARFAWPLYFMATIAACFYLQKILDLIEIRSKALSIGLLASVLLVWAFESNFYLDQKVFTQMHGNPYNQATKDEILSKIKEIGININEFQALYSVPVMEGWNDKFHIVPHFNSEFHSILFSMSTGTPMINAMHSRIGITDAMSAIQLSSHPYIEKERLEDLDIQRPILLMCGKGADKLTKGEQFLIDNSKLLIDEPGYELRHFDLNSFRNLSNRDSLVMNLDLTRDHTFSKDSSFFIRNAFDNSPSEIRLAGQGSKFLDKDETIIESDLPDSISGKYELSVYIKVDNKMYGMPIFELALFDSDQKEIFAQKFDSYQSKDIIESWIRAKLSFEIPETANKLQLKVSSINQDFYIDELLVRPVNTDVFSVNSKEMEILINNYKWNIK